MRYDWTPFDLAYDALPAHPPQGTFTYLAETLGYPVSAVYNHVRQRRQQAQDAAYDVGQQSADSGTPYPLLLALIQELPIGGAWTPAERDRWVRAFIAILDYYIEVV